MEACPAYIHLLLIQGLADRGTPTLVLSTPMPAKVSYIIGFLIRWTTIPREFKRVPLRTLGTSSSAELPEISTSAGSLVKTTWVLTLLRPASPRAVLVKKVVLLGSLASGASAFSPRLQILVKVGGCGTGGTGDDRFDPGGDYGCIQVGGGGGSGGCTTGTCGDLGGDGPGGAEWCCGDWVCDQQDADGNVKCRCVPRDIITCNIDSDCPEGEKCVDGFCVYDPCDCDADSDCQRGIRVSVVSAFLTTNLHPAKPKLTAKIITNASADIASLAMAVKTTTSVMNLKPALAAFAPQFAVQDEDCPPGSYCSGGYCFEGCRDSSECPAGENCSNGFCFPGCTEDADCDGTASCAVGGLCLEDM